MKRLLIILAFFSFLITKSQINNSLYLLEERYECVGISNSKATKLDVNLNSTNYYYLGGTNPNSITHPFSWIANATYDKINQAFIFIAGGGRVYTYDLQNDTLIYAFNNNNSYAFYIYSNLAFNCKDSSVYCIKQKDSLSTIFFYLCKISPKTNSITPISLSPIYQGKKLNWCDMDEKNNRYCFLDSLSLAS